MYITRDWKKHRGLHFGTFAVNGSSMVMDSECQVISQKVVILCHLCCLYRVLVCFWENNTVIWSCLKSLAINDLNKDTPIFS